MLQTFINQIANIGEVQKPTKTYTNLHELKNKRTKSDLTKWQ